MLEAIYSWGMVVLAVVFVLGVAINIHEFGHFIVARMLGMRVEAFSFFGIGPRIWGFKRGHTDYRISAIPLGAYVKLYGDEATQSLEGGVSDDEQVPEEELYELRPKWQKFLVMMGGPMANLILAVAIPFGVAMAMGVPSNPAPIIGRVFDNGAAQQAGLKEGDRIVAFNGVKDPSSRRIQEEAMLRPAKETPVTIEREGKLIDLKVTPTLISRRGESIGDLGFEADPGNKPVLIGQVNKDSPAAKAGLKPGDQITSADGKALRNQNDLRKMVLESEGAPLKLSVIRGEENLELSLSAQKVQENKSEKPRYIIGVYFSDKLEPVGLAGAVSHAFEANWRIIRMTGTAFGQMFAGERSVKEGGIGGPIRIVEEIAKIAILGDPRMLLIMLMVISLNLGIFNLLPIPLLDGGQIALLALEKVMEICGLTLSIAMKEKIQLAGLAMILGLMVVVFYFDISRLIG